MLRTILDTAASGRDASSRRIGDYYASCMDEPAIDRKSATPLDADLRRIDALKSTADLPGLLADLHAGGVNAFFPSVEITFSITAPEEHHHVPLLLSPFGYSTYRGS